MIVTHSGLVFLLAKKRAKYTLSLNYASRIKDTIAQSLTEASSKIVKWLFCLI